MKSKHNKLKNTGLIFEILVKQIASDTLSKKDSPALAILKKYYTGSSPLVKEFKLYQALTSSKTISPTRADLLVKAIVESSKKLDQKVLKDVKYKMISEIKTHYKLDEFFAVQVGNYKPLAALYCLLESENTSDILDIEGTVNNKATLLEHLTSQPSENKKPKDIVAEEYAQYDKDLRLLTFKILLEKFNTKYDNLLPEQKIILKEFITSTDSAVRLKGIVNEELGRISKELNLLTRKVQDDILKIKLEEIKKGIKPLKAQDKLSDKHLVGLMQYYDLIYELKKVK